MEESLGCVNDDDGVTEMYSVCESTCKFVTFIYSCGGDFAIDIFLM